MLIRPSDRPQVKDVSQPPDRFAIRRSGWLVQLVEDFGDHDAMAAPLISSI
jgi:hypothetical protein